MPTDRSNRRRSRSHDRFDRGGSRGDRNRNDRGDRGDRPGRRDRQSKWGKPDQDLNKSAVVPGMGNNNHHNTMMPGKCFIQFMNSQNYLN